MLYTIGHGALPFNDLLRRLTANGVRTVLDVRSLPYSSRAPHYNRTNLEAELVASGIAYRWLGDHLGGKPLVPDGPIPIADPAVLAAGVTEATGLARGALSALMCAEIHPTHCHRSTVLAEVFQRQGFSVVHILGEGEAVLHQPTLDL